MSNPISIRFSITAARYDAETSQRTSSQLTDTTGLYYLRNRYLDSDKGRFVMRDPIGIWGDAGNLGGGYSYAGNDPVNWRDPLGLHTQPCGSKPGKGGKTVVGDPKKPGDDEAEKKGKDWLEESGLDLLRRLTEFGSLEWRHLLPWEFVGDLLGWLENLGGNLADFLSGKNQLESDWLRDSFRTSPSDPSGRENNDGPRLKLRVDFPYPNPLSDDYRGQRRLELRRSAA